MGVCGKEMRLNDPLCYRAPLNVHDVVHVVVMPRWHLLQTSMH